MLMTDAQDRVVKSVARDVSVANWERVVADVEFEEHSDGYQFDTVGFALARAPNGQLSDTSYSLSLETRNAIIAMATLPGTDPVKRFSGFSIEINQLGDYRFQFSYGKPKRLNGVWDAEKESKIDRYTDHYRPNIWVLTAN